jgi:hypothetical protein
MFPPGSLIARRFFRKTRVQFEMQAGRETEKFLTKLRSASQTFHETVNPIPRIRAIATAVVTGSNPDTMNAAIAATVVRALRIASRMTSRICLRASSSLLLGGAPPPSEFELGSESDGGAD